MKKIICALMSLLVMMGCVLTTSINQVSASTEKIPTIIMHGFTGDAKTFKTMRQVYKQNGTIGENYGELTMSKDGKKITGHLKRVDVAGPGEEGYTRPVVNFLFKDNTASLQKQTVWFKDMVNYTKNFYGAKKVNIIGHSMGGLVATRYIVDTGGKDINKLVTLDSPILGVNPTTNFSLLPYLDAALRDLRPFSAALVTTLAKANSFNKNIKVMSYAATGSDVYVSKNSAHGLKIYTKNISVKEVKTTHTNIQHDASVINEVQKWVFK
ncbi:alpha/beta fold hydrolase [Domibacillus sp. PGB-M46]|uniref:alpha/beta fold hydrolase n=1 Tax=Domibacillus sp. PGB-M46 TaxID=2910255 RepID=UPI001F590294|nr:alpha/beta fold hydrolase [Domibacillus sp. PGB-M46]MCI2254558.1 alpha/beta fold hydrolase [Domibacillus sp. PGB-M46]